MNTWDVSHEAFPIQQSIGRLDNQLDTTIPWLQSLPFTFRHDEHSQLLNLDATIVRDQLRDEFSWPNLHHAVEFVAELAMRHIERRAGKEFIETIIHEPRLIELGLLIVAAQLTQSNTIPRDQEFYPAILLQREFLSVLGRKTEGDNPAVALLWHLVGLHEPAIIRELTNCTEKIDSGFSKGARWPTSEELAQIRRCIGILQHLWETLASQLIVLIQDCDGTLPPAAIGIVAEPHGMLSSVQEMYAKPINRPREKRRPIDLVRRAILWPRRIDRLLENLQGEFGVPRLYVAFQQAIWSKLLASIHTCRREPQTLAMHWGDIIHRDIAYPIAMGTVEIHDARELFENVFRFPVHKKRLSRQRERCLREPLPLIDADWMSSLDELAFEYLDCLDA